MGFLMPCFLFLLYMASIWGCYGDPTCGNGEVCNEDRCCSIYGFCGSGTLYCCPAFCQSQCKNCGVDAIISSSLFNEFSKNLNDLVCYRKNFYTYDAFIAAVANSSSGFATTGDTDTQKREIAAFFAQASHGITRGCGDDPTISFKTVLSFWMTPQSPKPSCHDVITGKWTPTASDKSAKRVSGFGVITNIINGGVECGKGSNQQVADRIGFFKRFCDILGVSYGDNLDCYNQSPWVG